VRDHIIGEQKEKLGKVDEVPVSKRLCFKTAGIGK
jgi:hypothetical protein